MTSSGKQGVLMNKRVVKRSVGTVLAIIFVFSGSFVVRHALFHHLPTQNISDPNSNEARPETAASKLNEITQPSDDGKTPLLVKSLPENKPNQLASELGGSEVQLMVEARNKRVGRLMEQAKIQKALPLETSASIKTQEPESTVIETNYVAGQKLALGPLPTNAPPPFIPDCERSAKIQELQTRIAHETNAFVREQDLLFLAACHIGQGDWIIARDIYKDLLQKSSDSSIRSAAQTNLKVAELQLSVLAESDSVQRELKELQLADLHQSLGHDEAAGKIYRRLSDTATSENIRQRAKESLHKI
jgi:hypothetical protein